MSSVYQIVTEQIKKKLQEGVAPWRKPWRADQIAMNWFTGKPYRGINLLLTESGGEYATYKQIKESGGKIKPSEIKNYTLIVFFMTKDIEDDKGKEVKIPILRYYRVYEINTQCEGLNSKRPPVENTNEMQPIERAEQLVRDFADAPEIIHKSGRAVYRPHFDQVSVPPLMDYNVPEAYYSTLFHELVHSTGHERRLKRAIKNQFGDELYSKEELVAEIGAAMLCGVAGIEQTTIDNSASYINGWLKALDNDATLIVMAANAAQKAADYIQNIKPNITVKAS
ncbi:antirestriction protein [Paenibacillus sp. FSL H7-0326]|uniref:ArdC family protein n=1 Tax=Paenibacillus sp. FSL H7-0326 TaxID=1921144 RepID=UPI00096EA06C|nr:zincin-like metallopeptidase domain-containing protein [Paenibacillus sp. FSL H7-0326]OMC63704.1 antirestriction protein [Paenibacillus sp. FSL H7-0326]